MPDISPIIKSSRIASNYSIEHSNKSFFRPFVQPKLTINQPNDIYEQEADAVAEKVMRMPDSKADSSFFQPKPIPFTIVQRKCSGCENEEKLHRKEDEEEEPVQLKPAKEFDVQRKCSHCEEEEEKVQMKGEGTANGGMTAPSIVHSAINSGGQPLDRSTRSFMESRFGYDFGNVQIHNDPLAHQSSKDINALAYTHGNHVVFGSGQYQPNTNSGKQLLAHELVHVVQQKGNNVVQRQGTKTAVAQGPINVIISLDNDTETQIQSRIRIKGAKQIRAYSLQDLVAKLNKLSGTIDNIVIYSHGTGVGTIKFVDKSGQKHWEDINDIAKALTGKVNFHVNNIEFEGCNLGNATSQLKAFGQSMNAKAVTGHSCFTYSRILTGINVNNRLIKKRSDIKRREETIFQQTLMDQAQKQLVAANGTSVTDCVEGITPNQTLDINELEKVFFASNGVINAQWDSPKFNEDWQPGSICKRDLTATTSPCNLFTVP